MSTTTVPARYSPSTTDYAVRNASSALQALGRRMPSHAHRRRDGVVGDIRLDQIAAGDLIVGFPHEPAPVDGVVVEGRSSMDESYLTREPYVLSKAIGSAVLSRAINGDGALTIRAEKTAIGSRYAKIMRVMRTGTLTYGQAKLTEVLPADGFARNEVLAAVAGLERYSRHPLSTAVIDAAQRARLPLEEAR